MDGEFTTTELSRFDVQTTDQDDKELKRGTSNCVSTVNIKANESGGELHLKSWCLLLFVFSPRILSVQFQA